MVGARRGAKLLFAMKRNNCNRSRCMARRRMQRKRAILPAGPVVKNSVFVQAETADMKPAWRMLTNSCRAAPPYKCRVLRTLSFSLFFSLSLTHSFSILPRFAFCYYGTEEKRIPCERTRGWPSPFELPRRLNAPRLESSRGSFHRCSRF